MDLLELFSGLFNNWVLNQYKDFTSNSVSIHEILQDSEVFS